MMRLSWFRSSVASLLAITLCSCAGSSDVVPDDPAFARQSSFQLASPRIHVTPSTRIIDDPVEVKLRLDRPHATLHYTLDGTAPTPESPRYLEPLVLRQGTTLWAAAFETGYQPSDPVRAIFASLGHRPSELSIEPSPAKSYAGDGAPTLFDGASGTENFRDGRWLGYQKPTTVTVDLGEAKALRSIQIGTRQDPGAWIFYPSKVAVSISNDGVQYQPWSWLDVHTSDDVTGLRFFETTGALQEARWLRIVISPRQSLPESHPGYPDGRPWLFLDEVLIHGE